jgi:hypothetical protein
MLIKRCMVHLIAMSSIVGIAWSQVMEFDRWSATATATPAGDLVPDDGSQIEGF